MAWLGKQKQEKFSKLTIGFHYHISFSLNENKYYLPTHFGLFIEELSKNVESLILFLHEDTNFSSVFYDYKIESNNVIICKLSNELPAYSRFFFGRKYIKKIHNELNKCDYLLLRGPSPMNYMFSSFFPKNKITNLVVGDYKAGNKYIKQPFYRLYAVKILNSLMHNKFIASLKNSNIAFNSETLYDKYNHLSEKVTLINTTNVLEKDILWIEREPLKNKQKIKLLFVGRLEWAKGLEELIRVMVELKSKKNQTFELHIVGWDETEEQSILKEFESKIAKQKLSDEYFFHGKKKPGIELYSFYQMADIFILPSYQEGFPRTIWEAFANCLPVITTPVGSISRKLENGKHALFCEVKNSHSIILQIENLIQNDNLHQALIKKGNELVKENNIEAQTIKLVNFIKN